MNIKFIRCRSIIFLAFAFLNVPCLCVNSTFAVGSSSGLSEGQLNEFAQNDILFYDPGDCISSGKFSSICGSTPREKYWSALRQELDEIHAAAVFGSIDNEGSFGTARWEVGVIVNRDGGHFIRSWDTLYNCTPGNCPGGVGAFGITWTLGPYLRQINNDNPDLLKYFKDPTNYSYPGDETLERIGDADYDRLVEQEVKYVINEADIESFKSITNLDEAADWWTKNYENCKDCCGAADEDHSCQEIAIRRASARKEYDEMKNFTCTASSSNGSNGAALSSRDIGQSIANKAIELAWGGSDKLKSSSPTKAFSDAAKSVGLDDNDDCLRFVQTVVLSSGVDDKFPKGEYSHDGGVDEYSTVKYMDDSSLWQKIDTTNEASLLPGDILVSAVEGKGNNHIFIYLGDGKVASANQGQWYGRIENLEDEWWDGKKPFYYGDNQYQVYRINPNQNCTTYEGDFPEYIQSDPAWGAVPYGPGCTIGKCGCGAASMAMLATVAAGRDVLPTDIVDLLGTDYYWATSSSTEDGMYALDKKVCEKYGCEVVSEPYTKSDFVEKAKDYLKKGYMIHLSGGCNGSGHSDSCPYSDGGHYIGIYKLTGDNTVMVADSGWGNKEYDLRDIASYILSGGVFSAIRGNGSGGACENNYCNNNSGPALSGLTESQAQKLADYYNGPNVDASEYGLPSGKTNCVSFSMWFTKAIASLSWVSGNGRDVAHALAEEHNLPEGTEPRPYALFSVTHGITYCGEALCGHTGIVVAVNGDEVLTVEAAYPSTPAYVTTRDRSYFENTVYQNTFTYLDSSVDQSKLKNIVGN